MAWISNSCNIQVSISCLFNIWRSNINTTMKSDVICIYYWQSARSRWLDIGVFMDQDEVEVHKNAKRERHQYPAILTELAWSIKDLLYGITSSEKNDLRVLVYFRALKRKPVLNAKVMTRAPTSWLDKCRKYNHLIGYISNFHMFKLKTNFCICRVLLQNVFFVFILVDAFSGSIKKEKSEKVFLPEQKINSARERRGVNRSTDWRIWYIF